MDFATTLESVRTFLAAHGYREALVGGVAMAAYGMARTTLDLDLVTEAAAQGELVEHLEASGYETLHRSLGYSNHLSPDPVLGRVDFVYVAGDTADRIFATTRALPGPGGSQVSVVSPEHLAAMKVLALANDPARAPQDLADLRFLLRLPGIDRDFVRQSFARHGRLDSYDRLLQEL